MATRHRLGKIILVILLGALAGTLLGELIGLVLPDGVVKDFFIAHWDLVLGPGTLNVVLFSITLGFTLKVNLIGFIGIGIAIYVLRWY
ncbi:hypothetical protein KC734_21585 [candidate division KSB1 bacterium]|nr:hypothetical protein [candidate division KSB1 bacterium]